MRYYQPTDALITQFHIRLYDREMKISHSQIGFLLFLLANATIYIRPWEIVPALAGVQIYVYLILSAALLSSRDIQKHLTRSSLLGQPITLCVLGVLAAVGISHLTNGYLGGAISGTFSMFKTVVYYLVLVSVINTSQRMRYFVISLIICGTICIGISVADYHNILPIESLTHIKERISHSLTGQDTFLFRLCGIGMFHDPNDLSLLIITTGALSFSQLTDRSWGSMRMIWLLPFPLLILALLDTHSRGGLIAAGAATLAFLIVRYGRSFAIAAAGMGVLAAPLVLGRMANIDISSGTGQQRIRLWSEGFVAIQSPKIFFGIGEGMYEDLANYVAHNSYVHAFVELGLFGGTMFVGCFFFAAYGIYRIKVDRETIYDDNLKHLLPYLAAVLAAWCAGFLSLSRCYPTPTYTIVGMMASYLNLVGIYLFPRRSLVSLDKPMFQRWIASSALVFIAMFTATKIFVRF